MSEPKKIKIYTPNGAFNGERGGVTFVDGVGEADEKTAKILAANYGYALKPFKEKAQK